MKTFYCCLALMISTFMTGKIAAQQHTARVLVLIHSDKGGTYELAKEIARGIETNQQVRAVIKQVKASSNPELRDIPVASVDELAGYDGLAFGSPVYFGNISTGMSEFLSKTVDLWTRHALEGMPATVFMSAGSGAGRELALQAFWNSLAVHGMVLVANGIRGYEAIDKEIPQGNTVLGTTSLASLKTVDRPSKSERYLAMEQGKNFAKVALALKNTAPVTSIPVTVVTESKEDINGRLKERHIVLPELPKAVGNYELFVRSGNLIFINQVALKNGKIFKPGKLGLDVQEDDVKEATRVTMLNVIAILKDALGGDLNRVKRCVQLIGTFNTDAQFTNHALLMNAASDLAVDVFGARGKHTRNTYGAYSLPLGSSVSIQAVFEVE